MAESDKKTVNTAPADVEVGSAADVEEIMKKYDRESNTRIWVLQLWPDVENRLWCLREDGVESRGVCTWTRAVCLRILEVVRPLHLYTACPVPVECVIIRVICCGSRTKTWVHGHSRRGMRLDTRKIAECGVPGALPE